jgi:hypothetical protein
LILRLFPFYRQRSTLEKLDLLQNKLYLVGNSELKFKENIEYKEIFKDLPLIFREV